MSELQNLPLCTWSIIALTVLVSAKGFYNESFERKFLFQPEGILAWKEYYRLITSAFLHANWWHLSMNMLSLYFFAPSIEWTLGPLRFLCIYLGAILGGDLLSLIIHRHHDYRSYGASGGVCGIIFSYILLFPGASVSMGIIPLWVPGWIYVILYMLISFYGMRANRDCIGHDAHLGGAIVGLLITAALDVAAVKANLLVFLLVLLPAIVLFCFLVYNPMLVSGSLPAKIRLFKPQKNGRPPATVRREQADLDAILDKIAKQGMESLSAQEKAHLTELSQKYQRRAQSEKPKSSLPI